jgi:hypothetical protein
MKMTQTTIPKIVQSSWNHREKYTKTTPSLHHNPHPGKSITQCSGHHLTHHTPHHTLCYSPNKLTQIATKDSLRLSVRTTFAITPNNISFAITTDHLPNLKQLNPPKQSRVQFALATSATNM